MEKEKIKEEIKVSELERNPLQVKEEVTEEVEDFSQTTPIEAKDTTETTHQRIKRQEIELNQLKIEQRQEQIKSEVVAIPKHRHCSCGAIFWNENPDLRSCLKCNPGRLE